MPGSKAVMDPFMYEMGLELVHRGMSLDTREKCAEPS